MLYDPEDYEYSLLIIDQLPQTPDKAQDLAHEWHKLLEREGWLGALQTTPGYPLHPASVAAQLVFFNGYSVQVQQQQGLFEVQLLHPHALAEGAVMGQQLTLGQLTQLLRRIEGFPPPSAELLGTF